MSIDVASLVFEIDSTQAVTARERLEALEKVGARVDASAAKTKSSTERTNAAHREAATQITKLVEKVGAYEKALAGAAGRQGAFERAVVDTATREAAAWAKVEQQLERRNAAYRGDLAAQTLRANEQAALAEARALEQSAAGWAKIEQALERRNAALRGDLAAEQAMQTARAAEQEAEAWRKVEAALERRNAELRGSQALEAMKAEAAAVASLEARIDKLMNSIDPTRAAQARLNAEMQEAASLYKAGAISAEQYAAATRVLDDRFRMAAVANDAVTKSMRHTRLAGVDLGRQFADVGVQAAMMTNPLMILVMQGPQIVDRLTDMKAQGIGLSAAMKSLAVSTWAALAPLAPFVLGVGAVAGVIGGTLALAARDLNKDNKDLVASLGLTEKQLDRLKDKGVDTGVTIGDVFKGTFDYIRDAVAPSLAPVGKWFSDLFDDITAKGVWAVKTIGGAFVGAFAAIKEVWGRLPAALGDIAVQAGNAVVRAIENTINKALEAYNKALPAIRALMTATGNASGAMGLREAGPMSLGQMDNPWSGAAQGALEEGAAAFKKANEGWSDTVDSVGAGLRKSILDATAERIRKGAGDADKPSKTPKGPADRSDEELLRLEQALAAARAEELQAQLALTEDVRGRADIEKQILDIQLEEKRADLARQAAKIERDADAKRITAATRDLMLLELAAVELVNAHVAALRQELIDREAIRNLVRRAYAIQVAGLQDTIDLYGSERDLAQFAFQRREIDLKILQHQQTIERLKLQEIVDTTAAGSAEHEIAKARLEVLDKIHGNQREGAFGRAEDMYDELARRVGDAVDAFKNQDWAKLVTSLVEAFGTLREVFTRTGATFEQKAGAVAGLANMAGQAIGGKAGSVISGAASGAMGGLALAQLGIVGGPFGAIAGAAIGGLMSMLSSNKAEKAAKNAEALKRAEEELARVREVAAKRRDLEIQLMEAQGDAAGALAARREDELRVMDASLRALQQQVWAAEDLAEQRQKVVDAAQRAVEDARSRLTDAYNAEAGALQETIDKFASFAESLKRFRDSLYSGPAAMLSPEEQYKATRDAFDRTSTLAAGGDADAIRDLESVSQAYLDASKAYYASSKSYFDDLERVRAAVTATQAYAASQVDVGQQQLNALNASVAGILDVNKSVLSVRDALVAYQGAVEALAAAQAANTPGANDNSAPKGPDWGSYIANNSDVAAEYLRNMASEKGRAYLAQLGIGSAEAFGQWHWNTSGKNEGRTPYADGGIFTNGVVSQPTTFHNSMMGEAGPEAIMPLVRTSDGLGVRATGGGHDAEIVSELKSLRSEVAKLQSTLKAANDQRGMGMQATLEKLDDVAGETARLRKARRPAA